MFGLRWDYGRWSSIRFLNGRWDSNIRYHPLEDNVKHMLDYKQGEFAFGAGVDISHWGNLGTPNNPSEQAITANQPALTDNGVSFTGTQTMQSLLGADMGDLKLSTVFCVMASDAFATSDPIISFGGNGASDGHHLIMASNARDRTSFHDGTVKDGTRARSVDTFYMSTITYDETNIANFRLKFYAESVFKNQFGPDVTGGVSTAINLYLNNTANTHTIKCIIIDDTEWDQAQIDRVNGWAAWRYGLTSLLASDHPYKRRHP